MGKYTRKRELDLFSTIIAYVIQMEAPAWHKMVSK